MNIFADFTLRVKDALQDLDLKDANGEAPDLSRVVVEAPRDPAHGDLATNAAMVLAKPLGMKPRDLAEQLVAKLNADPEITETTIAGPGFINLRVAQGVWHKVLGSVLDQGIRFGAQERSPAPKVNVEYVSANPTGPMHVGHIRGAVVGDALANILAFAGNDVVKEYYINDAGSQIDTLARSAFLRYREALGEDIGAIPAGLYPGDYLKPVGEKLKAEFGPSLVSKEESDWLPLVKERAIAAMLELIRQDLAALGVEHEVFYSERTLHDRGSGNGSKIDHMLETLRNKGLIYEGTLPPPKGQVPDDWEDREQTLFRASDFGDDTDRALKKSDGSYTYFAADVAYFQDKFERGFSETIYVLGADHGGYAKRLQAVGKAISDGKTEVIVRFCHARMMHRWTLTSKRLRNNRKTIRSSMFNTAMRVAVRCCGRRPMNSRKPAMRLMILQGPISPCWMISASRSLSPRWRNGRKWSKQLQKHMSRTELRFIYMNSLVLCMATGIKATNCLIYVLFRPVT